MCMSIIIMILLHMCRVTWIKVLGTRYSPGRVVVLSVQLVHLFGLICDVLTFDVSVYFLVCETLITECFCSHYHAYEVSYDNSPVYIFVKQSDLADHSVLGLYKFKYVVLWCKCFL